MSVSMCFSTEASYASVSGPDWVKQLARPLDARVADRSWNTGLDGEVWMLDGSHSVFGPEPASPGLSHYVAAKAAIVAFTRCLALEIGARNVNANCVGPGATRTPLIADISEELMGNIRRSIPKGRIGEVDDIVPSYVFLASDEARFYQGQCISPNGGDIFL
jgi:hypothetical protein